MKLLFSSRLVALCAIAIPFLVACSGESDAAYVARSTAAAQPGCVSAGQNQLRLSADAAKSMCSCAFNRLFTEHPIKELRRQEKAGAREETGKLMRPLMQACYEAEMKK